LPDCPKLSDLHRLFLAWSATVHHGTTTQIYRHYFSRHLAALGDVELSRVSPAMFAAVAKSWHSAAAAKRLFAWAFSDARLLKENPLRTLKMPPRAKRRKNHHAEGSSPHPAKMSAGHASHLHRLACIIRPARRDEARSLVGYPRDAAEYDNRRGAAARRSVLLADGVQRSAEAKESGYHPRNPDFTTARAVARLALRAATDRFRPLLFAERRVRLDKKFNSLPLAKDAGGAPPGRRHRGERLVPYHWRHTGATRAAAAGFRGRQLADVLAYDETRTTARYVHLSPADLAAALERAGMWRRAPPS